MSVLSRRRDRAVHGPGISQVEALRELTSRHGQIRDAMVNGKAGRAAKLWYAADRMARDALPAFLADDSPAVRSHAQRVENAHLRLAVELRLPARPSSW